jgi:hypothetical protein
VTPRRMYQTGSDLDRAYVDRRMYDAEVDARGWADHARQSFDTARDYSARGIPSAALEWFEHAQRVAVFARRQLQAYRAKLRDVYGP